MSIAPFQSNGKEIALEQQGQREMANLYSKLLREKAAWQRVSMGLLLSTMICVGIIVWMAGWGTRTEPYVIHMDSTGTERIIRPVPPKPIAPEQNIVRHLLTEWIQKTRAISNDIVVFQQNWDWVRDYTTNAGWQQIQAMREEQVVRQRAGTRVQVQVREILPVGGASQSWAIAWEERAYTPEGRPILPECLSWKATLRVADFQSQVAKQQVSVMRANNNFRNILGVFTAEVAFATPQPLELY